MSQPGNSECHAGSVETGLPGGPVTCPLCGANQPVLRARAHGRTYFQCARCRLTFIDPEHRLDAEAERLHYGSHQNDPRDARYRRFLSRLADPLVARLKDGAEGLDYGSGPGPTLSVMLEEQGYRMRIFDPFFSPDESALHRRYDFITATEVVEHFHAPGHELDRLERLLRPGGWLAIMTELLDGEQDISAWRYARDPTHAIFLSSATLGWIAGHYGWRLEVPGENVALFQKQVDERGL
jgi:SAM-dependent methyltransferase